MARAEENVVIRAGECTVTLMPAMGGKIGSLRLGDAELLQTPLKPVTRRDRTMAFSDADASGWDECLPSVAACQIETEAGLASVPDHGDLWRVPWQVLSSSEDSATLRANCFSLPLQLTRSVLLLRESATAWRFELLYSLTNMGAYRIPWSWCAHPLFAVDSGDRIILPGEVKTVQIEGSDATRLGGNSDVISWPIAKTASGEETDLSIAAEADSGIGDKLFAGPLHENWCALERKKLGLRLTVRFEPSLTPYLGLWLCYGGWPDAPGPKQVCVALEPATTPVDSLAKQGAWTRWLDPGDTCTWPMELQIERNANAT